MKIFIAHKKDAPALDELRVTVQANAPGATVITGAEDHDLHFKVDGNWPAWQRGVVERYDLFVVPNMVVGKATAEILEAALAVGKKAVYFQADGSATPIMSVQTIPGRDWANWAEVICG